MSYVGVTDAAALYGTADFGVAGLDFEHVYREYFGFAWSSLRRLGVPPEVLEDAVQDLFVVVYRRLDEFEGRSSLRTWLFAIARRVASRHRRTARRRERKVAALARESVPEQRLDEAMARRQAAEIVDEFLDTLDQPRREVFVLAVFEGMSGPEIAEALEVKVNTVYSRLRLARERFDEVCQDLRTREALLAAERDESRPPDGAMRRVAAMLPLSLGRAAEIGAIVSVGSSFSANAKIFAITLIVGLAGVLGAKALWGEPEGQAVPAVVEEQPPAEPPDHAAVAPGPPAQAAEPARAAEPVPRAATGAPRVRVERKPAAQRGSRAPSSTDRLGAELRLVGQIRAADRAGDHESVIRLAARHESEFPAGVLVPERRAYHVIALCKLGRDQAAASAAEFLAQFGATMLAVKVRAACPTTEDG